MSVVFTKPDGIRRVAIFNGLSKPRVEVLGQKANSSDSGVAIVDLFSGALDESKHVLHVRRVLSVRRTGISLCSCLHSCDCLMTPTGHK